jgi:transposase
LRCQVLNPQQRRKPVDRYIGLDAHTQSCTFVVLDNAGRKLGSQVVETNGRVLIDFVKCIPGKTHLCLEEGLQATWLHELLEPHVAELVVVTSQDRKHGPKNDVLDAQALAEMLRTHGVKKRVYKASSEIRALRHAARCDAMIVQDIVRVKNRLKAIFNARGLSNSGRALYDPESRSTWLEKLPESNQQFAALLGSELDGLELLRTTSEAWLIKEAKKHQAAKLLVTVPGIGWIRAAQVVAVVGTPYRFRTVRQFWTYCGLAVVSHTSSDWVRTNDNWIRSTVQRTRGLNQNRNGVLKSVFKGAALTVIGTQPEHPLSQSYQRAIQKGTKPNLARLTLARRIAAATLSIWKKKEVYDLHRAMTQTA